jgi:RHS repeat-associated protein
MTVNARRRALAVTPRLLCLALLSFALLIGCADAQSSKPTDGTTPLGLSPGAPAGSYALGGFDNINLYNGNLNFRLPLLSVGGRGGAGHTVMLPVEQHWQVEAATVQIDDYTETHYYPENDWWQSDGAAYSPGTMRVRDGGFMWARCLTTGAERFRQTLTRLTFTAADGTEYEFRDQLTGGQRSLFSQCSTTYTNRGKVFVTADGTSATFISDVDIIDMTHGSASMDVSGYMMLKDGTRYRIDGGLVSWFRDRNGNRISFTYGGGYGVSTITDSLNRQVTISYNVADGGQYGTCDHINFKGFGGAARTVRVCKTDLGSALRTGYSLQTPAQLFGGLEGSNYSNFNPTVVSAVWLPGDDGVTRRYQLRYNPYGELARVELPTGGAVEYDHAAGLSDATDAGGVITGGTSPQIYRRVVERREYADGVNLTNRMTYSRPESCTPSCVSTVGYVVTDQTDAAGALLARQRHYFHGAGAASSITGFNPVAYPAWNESREYKTEVFDTNGTTVLRRVENTWQANGTMGGLSVNPVVSQTLTTLVDTNQVAKQTFSYDAYSNQADVYDYDYGAGAPGALIRRTHTDYLTTNPVNGANYATDTAVHIRSLPKQISVYDAAGAEQARTTFEYDNYAADASHAALAARANISGLDAAYTTAYTTRGNATASSRWLLATNTPVTAYAQYDVAGNVVKAIDARGNASTLDYADRYGAPNGEARSNTQPAELGAQATYAFATSAANALGHTAYTQFDYYLGKPVEVEDVNGVVSSGYYNDVLDRPTQLVLAVGTNVQSQTSFVYNDAARVVTTTSDLAAYNDNLLKSEIVYDQLGRTYESRQYESASNYSATQRSYDALGRAYRMSNPFRPWQSQSPVWTTTQFDALGRTVRVTTPDGAQVVTAYGGNQVTVTDQANRLRRSVTDALGRMTEVVEDPAGLAYATDYTYDVLGNLRQVAQGSQRRYFLYDSLSRLLRAKLPEQAANASLVTGADPVSGNTQWSAAYDYDAGGNLLHRTDARGVVATYTYDALSRVTQTSYSDGTATNIFGYDAAANGRGRFYYAYDNSTSGGFNYVTGYDAAGRPLRRQTDFFLQGVGWVSNYAATRAYDLAGNVTSETYPSGHTVSYSYDAAGRLATFAGSLGDGAQRTYSTGIAYDEAGRMTREQFGAQVPLYHKSFYNVRGQLFDTRLSSVNDTWDWNRGRLIFYYSAAHQWGQSGTDNNGNVVSVENWVPPANATLDQADTLREDKYTYDSLNRLSRVEEQMMSASNGWTWAQQFAQGYAYDRYGNRQIDAGATWGAGINNKQFTVDAATNRLTAAGMAYDAAGNLTQDTYSATAAQRAYDAENRMAWEQNSQTSIYSRYTYDSEGHRARRDAGGSVTWAIYGFGGEVLAEYAQGASPASPQKEYGYRGGELLVTAEAGGTVNWLISDHLGTPRMVADQTGSLSGVKRHDYLPFGEELTWQGGRDSGHGYNTDSVKQKYTGYEHDGETNLNFAEARYHSDQQGRFTSVDPLSASAKLTDPQSFNRYSYVGNKPTVYSDPSGLTAHLGGRNISNFNGAMASEQATEGITPWPDIPIETAVEATKGDSLDTIGADGKATADQEPDYVVNATGPRILSFDVTLLDTVEGTGKKAPFAEVPVGGRFEITYTYVTAVPTGGAKPEDQGFIAPIKGDVGTLGQGTSGASLIESKINKIDKDNNNVTVTKTDIFKVVKPANSTLSPAGSHFAVNYRIVVKNPNTGEMVWTSTTGKRFPEVRDRGGLPAYPKNSPPYITVYVPGFKPQ